MAAAAAAGRGRREVAPEESAWVVKDPRGAPRRGCGPRRPRGATSAELAGGAGLEVERETTHVHIGSYSSALKFVEKAFRVRLRAVPALPAIQRRERDRRLRERSIRTNITCEEDVKNT